LDKDITEVLDLANTHSNEGEYEIAIELLRETLKTHPNNLSIRTTLGVILAKANKDHESERVLKSVIRRDPYYEDAISALGRLLDNSLRTHESEQLYRNFLKAKPNSNLIRSDFARMLLEDGKIDEAFSIARDYLKRNPDELGPYTLLRELLLLEETRLEDNLLDSDYKAKDWEFLVSNLIEQYELIREMEHLIDTTDVEPDLIHDELFRLLGRFHELDTWMDRVDGQISSAVLEFLKQSLIEISMHIEKK
jgi:tetratricopeptide (TPR) repeat protein